MTHISKMKFSNNEYPSIDEYVLCQITNFVELNGLKGAYCKLLHYNDKEALLLPLEAVKNKYQRIEKVHKIGNNIICQVITIDGNHIDLSYKRVSEEESKKQLDKLYYLEKIWEIINWIKMQGYFLNNDLDELFFDLVNLDDLNYQQFYEKILEEPEELFNHNESFKETDLRVYVNGIKKKINIIPYLVSSDFILYSIHEKGIENIKTILNITCNDIITNKNGYIELHSLPVYRIVFKANNNDEINKILDELYNKLNENVTQNHSIFSMDKTFSIVHQRKMTFTL